MQNATSWLFIEAKKSVKKKKKEEADNRYIYIYTQFSDYFYLINKKILRFGCSVKHDRIPKFIALLFGSHKARFHL